MKKKIIIISTITTLLLISIIVFITSISREKTKIGYKESDAEIIITHPTYRFYGKSEHFAFETGKVYYGDNGERQLLITNFKKIKNLKKEKEIKTISINLYFNNELFYMYDGSDGYKKIGNSTIEKYLSRIKFEEISYSDAVEFSAFSMSSKEDFKKTTKLVIKYCYENDNCLEEILQFHYVKYCYEDENCIDDGFSLYEIE